MTDYWHKIDGSQGVAYLTDWPRFVVGLVVGSVVTKRTLGPSVLTTRGLGAFAHL